MELRDLRKEIDDIDDELVKLFCRRMEVAERVAAYKQEKGLPVLDASREETKLQDVMKMAGPEMEEYVLHLYKTLFEVSRAHQKNKMNG